MLHVYLKFFAIAIGVLLVSSCATHSTKVSLASAPGLWVSDSFKAVKTKEDNIKLYVSHREGTNVADYFLIVHEGDDYKRHGMVAGSNPNFYEKDLGMELVGKRYYTTSAKIFDAISKDKGEYYRLIEKTIYAAPSCGLLKQYVATYIKLKITLVDAVSCGQLSLEVGRDSYKAQFQERINSLLTVAEYAFSDKD